MPWPCSHPPPSSHAAVSPLSYARHGGAESHARISPLPAAPLGSYWVREMIAIPSCLAIPVSLWDLRRANLCHASHYTVSGTSKAQAFIIHALFSFPLPPVRLGKKQIPPTPKETPKASTRESSAARNRRPSPQLPLRRASGTPLSTPSIPLCDTPHPESQSRKASPRDRDE